MTLSEYQLKVFAEYLKAQEKKSKKKKEKKPAPAYGGGWGDDNEARAADDSPNFKQGNTFKGPNKPRTKDTKKCPPGKVYRNGKCVKK